VISRCLDSQPSPQKAAPAPRCTGRPQCLHSTGRTIGDGAISAATESAAGVCWKCGDPTIWGERPCNGGAARN